MLRHRVGHPAEPTGRLCSPLRPAGDSFGDAVRRRLAREEAPDGGGKGKDFPAERQDYDRMEPKGPPPAKEAPGTIPASYPMSEDL